MLYEHRTVNNLIQARIVVKKKELPVLRIEGYRSFIKTEICALFLFDMLAEAMSINSKNAGVRRRAYQLKGYSLADAIKKTYGK